jgi:hypothetical protein
VAAKQLRFAGHPFQVLLAGEDYLKWLTTQSNAFLADLESRYPVFKAALSEALDKIAAPKSEPVKRFRQTSPPSRASAFLMHCRHDRKRSSKRWEAA